MPLMPALSPAQVLQEVADALPKACHPNVIIVGSLAAGFHYFGDDGARAVRTKDVDCMFSPHAKAVGAARQVTQALLREQWQHHGDARFPPGGAATATEELPMVRLRPPGNAQWFLELLGAPEAPEHAHLKTYSRVVTPAGHFAICRFSYMALAEWHPVHTRSGLRIARPETMALANLLHHPFIGDEVMSGDHFGGHRIKRSNKDLGRVLSIAYLARERDLRRRSADFGDWHLRLAQALRDTFPARAAALASQAGNGLRALLNSQADLDQATRTCNLGLLATMDVSPSALAATGRRVLTEMVEPLQEHFAG